MNHFLTIIFLKLSLVTLIAFPKQEINSPVKDISNNSITKISFTSAGGRSDFTENLEITPSSLIYIQGRNGSEKSIKEMPIKSFWTNLTKAINIKEFDKIKSTPGHALFDGIDLTITIERGKEKHTLVNGADDSYNYPKIKSFTDLLEKKLIALRTKMKW